MALPTASSMPAAESAGHRRRLSLRAVELEGFKSYAERVVIGDPFGPFTCVVGPNGCGKSVVGEAIAFALGGNTRMMRARNLGALVTNLGGGGSGSGSGSSSRSGALPAAAEVVLHFELFDDTTACDSPGSGSSLPTAHAAHVARPAGQLPAGRQSGAGALLVRRRVTRSGRSELTIRRLSGPDSWSSGGRGEVPDSSGREAAASGGGSGGGRCSGGRGSTKQWQAVTPAALHDLLAPYGIQTEAVDRFVVTQHRQAVSVQDPSHLARFLELLIGTADFEEQLVVLGREVAEQAAAYDRTEECIAELELQRQQLAPEVAKWRRYHEQSARHRLHKVEVLGHQEGLLVCQLAAMRAQASELEASVAQQSSEQAASRSAADELLQRKTEAAKALRQAEKRQTQLAQAATAAQLQAAKLRVQLKVAEAAAVGASGVEGQGHKASEQLQRAEREVENRREVLAVAQAALEELQKDEAAAAARVAALQAGVAADGAASTTLAAELAAAQQAAEHALAKLAAARQQQQNGEATVVAAEAELAAIAAARQQTAERQRAAAEAVQQLRLSQPEQLQQQHEAEERLATARQQQYQAAAAADEARSALAAAEAQLRELELPIRAAGRHSAAAGKQSADQAIAALAADAAAGKLPGEFHGRLHSVARLAPQQAQHGRQAAEVGTAVNAALKEVCNLASTLVVSDRPTAQAAVSHFERHLVGIATCKILSELQASGGAAAPAALAAEAAEVRGLQPLAACVEARSDVKGADALVRHLLRNWWLAPNRQAAMAAAQQARQGGGGRSGGDGRRNIVTMQGEVFKADGEIVGARSPPRAMRPYLLSSSFAPPGSAAPAAVPALTAAERDALQQQAAALREEAQQRQAAEQAAAQQAELAALEMQRLREEQVAAAAKLESAERQLRLLQSGTGKQKQARQEQRAQQLEQSAAAGRQQAAAGAAAAAAAGTEAAQAEQAVVAAKAAYEASLACSKCGSELLAAQGRLDTIGAAAARAKEHAADATAGLAAATRQQQQLAAAEHAAQQAAADAERLRGEVEAAETAAVAAQEGAASLAAAAEQHSKEKDKLVQDWRAAIKRHEAATKQCQQQQVALKQLQDAQAAAQQRLAAVQADLAAARENADGSEVAEGGKEAGNAEDQVQALEQAARGGGSCIARGKEAGTETEADVEELEVEEEAPLQWRHRLLRTPRTGGSGKPPAPRRVATASAVAEPAHSVLSKRLLATSSSKHDGSSGSRRATGRTPMASSASARGAAGSKRAAAAGSATAGQRASRSAAVLCGSGTEEDSEDDFEPDAQRAQRSARSRLRRGRRRAAAAAAGEQLADWGEEHVQAALDALEREEAALQALRASLDEAAPADDAAVAERLEAEGRRLDGLAEALQALELRQAGQQEERFQRFHSALTAVNSKLTGVYSRLTGGQGDAYCSYTEDRLAAFADGVTFHVRPDRQRWRSFQVLSGGQQALATLALCFALQAAFPSPFYFFDEIDASLDTVNASRVAEYIAAQRSSGAQFIVSHKPQVYEQAGCLVGVYSYNGASRAVTLHLADGSRGG